MKKEYRQKAEIPAYTLYIYKASYFPESCLSDDDIIFYIEKVLFLWCFKNSPKIIIIIKTNFSLISIIGRLVDSRYCFAASTLFC